MPLLDRGRPAWDAEGAEFSLSEEDEADEGEEEEDEDDDDASERLLFLLILLDEAEGWAFASFKACCCEICEASSWASETASIPAYSCKPASSL